MLPTSRTSLSLLTDVTLASVARGDVLYRGASKWNNLAPGASGTFLKSNGAGADPSWASAGVSDHGGLTGLSDDDHSIYALLAGRAGGQTLIGEVASGVNAAAGALKLYSQSTGNATPGSVIVQSAVAGASGSSAQTLFNYVTFANSETTWRNSAGNIVKTDSATGKTSWSNTSGAVLCSLGVTADTYLDLVLGQAGGCTLRGYVGGLEIYPGAGYGITLYSGNSASIPLVIVAAASQASNLQEYRASDGTTVYSAVSENGYFTTRKNSAPADAELAASEAAYWFDSTNGAAKFKVKAKTADGTVVSGELALA